MEISKKKQEEIKNLNKTHQFTLTSELSKGFVYVKEVIPNITIDLRYYSEDNFVGECIDGYLKPKCILSTQAAWALKKVQTELKKFKLGLKIYDTYRPQYAVDHFIHWAKDLKNIKMKAKYYPDVLKKNLFKEGYIFSKSSHSRGSTVDLTIISLNSKKELDMGSGFDFFDPKSWPSDLSISTTQRAHRMLLQLLMDNYGFQKNEKEWWHFTLKNEPFPDTYFDFPVQ
jgi:zinc D-Ala-D-Ala dipeptidase